MVINYSCNWTHLQRVCQHLCQAMSITRAVDLQHVDHIRHGIGLMVTSGV